MQRKSFKCSACLTIETTEPKNGKFRPPRNWKLYGDVWMCDKCRKGEKGYYSKTLKWMVQGCAESGNVTPNAVEVRIKTEKPKFPEAVRYLAISDETPESPEKLRRWVVKYARDHWKIDESKIVSVKRSFDFIRFLEPQWLASTDAANFVMQHLLRCENLPVKVSITAAGKKTIPSVTFDLNDLRAKIRDNFPSLAPHSIDSILQKLPGAYKDKRYDIFVNRDHSLLSYKFGYPILIRATHWEPFVKDDKPYVKIKFGVDKAPDSEKKAQFVILELRSGYNYKSYISQFKQLADTAKTGDFPLAVKCEMSIKGEKKAGRPRSATKVFLNMGIEMRKKVVSGESRRDTLYVETAADSFIVARVHERQLWRLNGDQLPKIAASHRRYLQRLSDDSKYEFRVNRKKSPRDVAKRRDSAVEWYSNKTEDFIKRTVAAVVNFAARRRFKDIVYDDSTKMTEIAENFPWYKLKQQFKSVCDREGIQFYPKDEIEKLDAE